MLWVYFPKKTLFSSGMISITLSHNKVQTVHFVGFSSIQYWKIIIRLPNYYGFAFQQKQLFLSGFISIVS